MSANNSDVVRMKGQTIIKPIVYGNSAKSFGKKREEDSHTHSWVLYVRPYFVEDMSRYIRKVVFKLHDSYANPTRVITEPPYEVRETGWGEFEAAIKIFFQDPSERHVTFYHTLKLFNPDPLIVSGKKSLINEFYDELVFQDPTILMYNLLGTSSDSRTQKHVAKHDTNFNEKQEWTLRSIKAAKEEVKTEIKDLKDCLKESKTLIVKFKEEIAKAEKDGHPKSKPA